ncbi:MAG: hypothetical protein IJX26_03840 [Clostridia bacterium]|nr:hypothetical protein [Clostridia bacterium]
MKLGLMILLVILIMVIANGISKQYRERNYLFVNLFQFLSKYELNIGFKKEKMISIVNDFKGQGDIEEVLQTYKKYLIDNKEINLDNIKNLTDEERLFLNDMFVQLGNCDYQTEKNQLIIFKDYIQQKKTETEAQKNKYCPLILKLSLLFAIGLAILFI